MCHKQPDFLERLIQSKLIDNCDRCCNNRRRTAQAGTAENKRWCPVFDNAGSRLDRQSQQLRGIIRSINDRKSQIDDIPRHFDGKLVAREIDDGCHPQIQDAAHVAGIAHVSNPQP